jgi:hypothetical protein
MKKYVARRAAKGQTGREYQVKDYPTVAHCCFPFPPSKKVHLQLKISTLIALFDLAVTATFWNSQANSTAVPTFAVLTARNFFFGE